MKTKEAIEKVEVVFDEWVLEYSCSNKTTDEKEEEKKEIIRLLERGEKYEKIFNTILNWTIHDGSFIPIKELTNLEQKYFPKCGSYFFEATSKDPHLKKISFASSNISRVRLLKPKKVIK